ncbi:unnamed protein product, partial [Ixodes hexagonus]
MGKKGPMLCVSVSWFHLFPSFDWNVVRTGQHLFYRLNVGQVRGGLLQQEAVLQRRHLDTLEEKARNDTASEESLRATSARLTSVTDELKVRSFLWSVLLIIMNILIQFRYVVALENTLVSGLEKLSSLVQEQRERKEQQAHWLEQMHERLDLCSDVTGSRPVLQTRLDKLQELERQLPDGTCQAKSLSERTSSLVQLLAPRERTALEEECSTLETDLARLGTLLEQARHSLAAQLRRWDAYEEHYGRLASGLQGAERSVREFALRASLDDKNEQLEQYKGLLSELHATEQDLDSLSDKAQELIATSGEMRLSMAVTQLTARFQALLETCKELVKKCEQHVQDHIQFEKKHAECSKKLAHAQESFVEIQSLPSGNKERLAHKLARVKELLQGKSEALNLVNATVQLAEQLQVGSSPEGWEATQGLLQQLQTTFETTFSGAQSLERSLQSTLFLWSEYQEVLQRLRNWLKGLCQKTEGAPRLCTTLEEKKTQLRTCRVSLGAREPNALCVPDSHVGSCSVGTVTGCMRALVASAALAPKLKRSIVVLHQTLDVVLVKPHRHVQCPFRSTKHCATRATAVSAPRVSLLCSASVHAEKRTDRKVLSEKVITALQSAGLASPHHASRARSALLRANLGKIAANRKDRSKSKRKSMRWVRPLTSALFYQLRRPRSLTAAGELHRFAPAASKPFHRISTTWSSAAPVGDSASRTAGEKRTSRRANTRARAGYVRILNIRVPEYREFDSRIELFENLLFDSYSNIRTPLIFLSDEQINFIKKNNVFCVCLVEFYISCFKKATGAVAGTRRHLSGEGTATQHTEVGGAGRRSKEHTGDAGTHASVGEQGGREAFETCKRDHVRVARSRRAVHVSSARFASASFWFECLTSKRERKTISLDDKAAIIRAVATGTKKSEAAKDFDIAPSMLYTVVSWDLTRLPSLVQGLVETTEQAYQNHLDFKNACDDMVTWLRQLREKLPPFTRSLSDRLSLETSISVLEELLAKRAEGNLKLEAVTAAAERAKSSTSEPGVGLLDNQTAALQGDLTSLFDEISATREKLGTTCSQLREFREEYEHVSEWLQLMEDDIKNQRTLLWPTLQEKKVALDKAQGLVEELEKGHEALDRVTLLAQGLLTSHLDTYIRNQLTLVSSRYQVSLNLAKDMLSRARENHDQHEQYRAAAEAARNWMETTAAAVAQCSGATAGKNDVECQLAKVQGMVRKQEEGHALLHTALTSGEKALRGTHSSGRGPLSQEMQELQKQWDRLMLKLSDAKVSLETALLQWTDYSSSEKRLLQWIEDHDHQLEEVKKPKQSASVKESVAQRKARLRRANSLVQDVESFEPMIESLTIKAQELQQTAAAPCPEISEKYSSLAGSVKEFLRHQKSVMGHLQEFTDACSSLTSWLEQAQEKLNKCAEPSGDRAELKSKHSILKKIMMQFLHCHLLASSLVQSHIFFSCYCLKVPSRQMVDGLNKQVSALPCCDFYNFQANGSKIWLANNPVENMLQVLEAEQEEGQKRLQLVLALAETARGFLEDTQEREHVDEEAGRLVSAVEDFESRMSQAQNNDIQSLIDFWDADISDTSDYSDVSAEPSLTPIELMYNIDRNFGHHKAPEMTFSDCLVIRTIWVSPSSPENRSATVLPTFRAMKTTATDQSHKNHRDRALENVYKPPCRSGERRDHEADRHNYFIRLEAQLLELPRMTPGHMSILEMLKNRQTKAPPSCCQLKFEEPMEFCQLIAKKRIIRSKFGKALNNGRWRNRLTSQLAAKHLVKLTHTSRFVPDDGGKTPVSSKERTKDKGIGKKNDAFLAHNPVSREWVTVKKRQHPPLRRHEVLHARYKRFDKKKQRKTTLKYAQPSLNPVWYSSITVRQQDRGGPLGTSVGWHKPPASNKCTLRSFHKIISKTLTDIPTLTHICIAQSSTTNYGSSKAICALLEEASFHKPDMEELNEQCEHLLLVSAQTSVRDQAVRLSTTYASLVAALQDAIAKLQRTLGSQEEFDKAKQGFVQWFEEAQQSLNSAKEPGGDLATVQEHLAQLKKLHQSLPEGKQLLDAATEAASRTLGDLSDVSQAPIRAQVDALRDQLTALGQQTSEATGRLASLQSRWQELIQGTDALRASLQSSQEMLKEKPVSGGDLVRIRSLLEQYKHTARDLEEQGHKLQELRVEASELVEKTGGKDVSPGLQEIAEQLASLQKKCQDTLESLDEELHEAQSYHRALQETEKWLLQMSFPVMAQHSLQVLNRQQTQEQLDKYKGILAEVKQYQSTLDEVKAKGRRLVKRYQKDSPQLEQQVQSQLDNIQESYDALLAGAIQVEARLESALQKFVSYETTLDVCDLLLAELEPKIAQLSDDTPKTPESTKIKLETCKGLMSQLVNARVQLQEAIQGCVEAVSSVSRPSSPELGTMFSMPEQEASIKIRLQDNIEQLEAHVSQLEELLRGFEEAGRQRAALEDWLTEKQSAVSQLGASRLTPQPLLLHSQLRQLEDIKQEVSEKLTAVDALELKSGLPGPSEASLRDRLHQLEAQVAQVASMRTAQLETLEEYGSLASQVETRLAAVESSLETTHRPTVADAKQRLQMLNVLLDEVNSIGGNVAELRGKMAVLTKCLEPSDKAKCDDQLKCLEGKCEELRKRVLRRTKSLDLIQSGLDGLYSEAASTEQWLREKKLALEQLPNPGYQSTNVEAALQRIKAEQREVENKRAVVQDFEKRIESLSHELDSLDAQQLEQTLQDLRAQFADVMSLLASRVDNLTTLLSNACHLDDEVEIVRQWLREKEQDLRRFGVPAEDAAEAQSQLDSALEKEVKSFEEGRLAGLVRHGRELESSCEPTECAALQKLVQEPVDKVKELRRSLAEKLKQLKEVAQLHDEYRKALAAAEALLNEMEASMAGDLLLATCEEVLQEQAATHTRVRDNGRRLSSDLAKMKRLAGKLGPSAGANRETRLLSERKDSLLKIGITTSHHPCRLEKMAEERLQSLEEALAELQRRRSALDQTSEELDELCRRMDALGGSLGPAVQDAEVLLTALQKLVSELKDLQGQLERLQGPGPLSESVGRLAERCEAAIQRGQTQLGRAKHALTLRQQYHHLREQVAQAVARLTDTVAVLEKAKKPAAEKLPQYENLLAQVADAEGQLTSAQDKGEAIAQEGSSVDRNTLLGDLANLKGQLAALRKAIQGLRAQEQTLLAEQQRQLHALEEALQGLRADEALARSRPPLAIQPDSVDAEIRSHQTLQQQAEAHLAEAQVLHDQLFQELPSELLASQAQEALSELSLLRSTLPQQLQERSRYLDAARAVRHDYWAQRDTLVAWLDQAEQTVAAAQDGVDFDGLDARCKELRVRLQDVSSETTGYGECLRSLQALLTQIRPTMDPEACLLPEQELASLQQRLAALTSAARSALDAAQNDLASWAAFGKLRDQVEALVAKLEPSEERPDSTRALRRELQALGRLQEEAQRGQTLLDQLSEAARTLERRSGPKASGDLPGAQAASLGKRWQTALDELQARKERLGQALAHWDALSQSLARVRATMEAREHDLAAMQPRLLDVTATEDLLSQVSSDPLGHQVEDACRKAEPVLGYLDWASQPAASSLRNELQALRDRHSQLKKSVEQQLKGVREERAAQAALEEKLSSLRDALLKMNRDIASAPTCAEDEQEVERNLQELRDRLSGLDRELRATSRSTHERYGDKQHGVPEAVGQALASVELLSESVLAALEGKEREFKKARTARSDYCLGVKALVEWLRKAQDILQRKGSSPEHTKESLINVFLFGDQGLSSELPSVRRDADRRVVHSGQLLAECLGDSEQAQGVRVTVASLGDQLQQV